MQAPILPLNYADGENTAQDQRDRAAQANAYTANLGSIVQNSGYVSQATHKDLDAVGATEYLSRAGHAMINSINVANLLNVVANTGTSITLEAMSYGGQPLNRPNPTVPSLTEDTLPFMLPKTVNNLLPVGISFRFIPITNNTGAMTITITGAPVLNRPLMIDTVSSNTRTLRQLYANEVVAGTTVTVSVEYAIGFPNDPILVISSSSGTINKDRLPAVLNTTTLGADSSVAVRDVGDGIGVGGSLRLIGSAANVIDLLCNKGDGDSFQIWNSTQALFLIRTNPNGTFNEGYFNGQPIVRVVASGADYTVYSNGVIMQKGSILLNGGGDLGTDFSFVVTYPYAFPNTNYTAIGIASEANGGFASNVLLPAVLAKTASQTTFNVKETAPAVQTNIYFDWTAIYIP